MMDPEGNILATTMNRQHSTMIPPTPGADAPMTVLSGDDIRQLSAEGMSTDVITHLFVPHEIAKLATTLTPMAL